MEILHPDMGAAVSMSDYRTEPSNTTRVWQAVKGKTLKSVLEDWSATENIPVSWHTDQKHTLDYDVFISGTFENAVAVLLSKGLKNAPPYDLNDTPYRLNIGDNE